MAEKDIELSPPVNEKCVPSPGGLGVVLLENLKKHPDNIIQIDSETGKTMTYSEFLKGCINTAEEIKRRGINENDIIAINAHNSMHNWMPLVASLLLGIKSASLDPSLSATDTVQMLNIIKPRIAFCSADAVELMETSLSKLNLQTEIVVFGDTEKNVPFSEFLVSKGTEDTFEAKYIEDVSETAVIMFSSGTSGDPKAVCLPHYGFLYLANLNFAGSKSTVDLFYSSTYWISNISYMLRMSIAGTARLICPKFDLKKLFVFIEKYKVSGAFLPPSLSYQITQNPELCTIHDTSSLKLLLIGGMVVSKKHLVELRKLLPHAFVGNGYGMTEHCGVVMTFSGNFSLYLEKVNTIGRPMPGVSYKIIDLKTNEPVGFNQEGELRIKSKCLMNGYYKDEEGTKAAFDEEGYMKSGDVAYYDEDYCFFITDRIKDLIKYQSWRVNPSTIECAIKSHPDVKEAIVIGVPHEEDGEHPRAVVVPKPGTTINPESLINYVNEKVDDRSHLRGGVIFVDEIPTTATNKYKKRILRAQYAKQQN